MNEWVSAGFCAPAALAVSQTFENSLYVRTSSVGLDLRMETSEGAPRESVWRGML